MRISLRRAALALILAYAAFLRLHALGTIPGGLYRDEAMNGNNALEALETHRFAVFYPENNGREGLYIDLAAAPLAWFGNQPWALRLPAAIFGILTVAGLYLLGAECFDPWTALAAAFFLATSFWHVNFSRLALRAIAAPCCLTWSLYLLLAGLRKGRWQIVAAAGAVYGSGFYTYIAYRATPLLLALLLLRAAPRARRIFAAAGAAVAAPLAVYFFAHPASFWARTGDLSVFHNSHPVREIVFNAWRTARMFFTRGDLNWRHNIAYRAELYWPVAALFAVGVTATLVRWLRRRSLAKCPGGDSLPLVWLAVAALPVIFSDDVLPHALRSILMAPAVFLVAGTGARAAYAALSIRTGPRAARAAVAIAVLWLAWEPYHSYFDLWARNPNVPAALDAPGADLARRLLETPGDKTVYVPAGAEVAAAPVMFLTGTYTAREQRARHIRYVSAACPPTAAFCVARYDK